MFKLTICPTLIRNFQFGSPHNGFKTQTPLLISFALTLFQVQLTTGNTLKTMETVMPQAAPFSLTPISGWQEWLNQVKTAGIPQTVWVEDLTTTTLLS